MVGQKKLAPHTFYIGSKSRVFLKSTSDRLVLERERNVCILCYIIKLQKHIRLFVKNLQSQREVMQAKRQFVQKQEEQKKMSLAAVKVQRVWRGKQVRILFSNMYVFIELRKCIAKRDVHRIKELLLKIDSELANPSAQKSSNKKGGRGGHSTRGGLGNKMLLELFEHDIKIARIMYKLMEIQETLISSLQKAIEAQNITELNRLLLKADRLELTSHVIVVEAKNTLLTLHKKRKIMKVLLKFLSNEDCYSDDIINTIEEAKVYNIDIDFLSKVQSIYNNAGKKPAWLIKWVCSMYVCMYFRKASNLLFLSYLGPRLKTRNKLRMAIEHIHIECIEQGVLEVMEIRKHHSMFAEAELRAARMMLRMCYFDSLLFAKKKPGDGGDETKNGGGGEGSGEGGEDKDKDLPKLWNEPLLSTVLSATHPPSCYTIPLLTPSLIELCNAITDSTQFPAIRKLQQQKLMDTCGSLDRCYEVIRYFKWSRMCCTWKYPEITQAVSSHSATPSQSAHSHASHPSTPLKASVTSHALHSPHPSTPHYGDMPMSMDDLDEGLDVPQKKSAVTPNTEFKQLQKTKSMVTQSPHTPSRGGESGVGGNKASGAGGFVGEGGGGVGVEAGGGEDFYQMDFSAARGNAYVIRCLHQDFDMFLNTTNNQNASLDAALGNVEISSSMQDSLVNLDLLNDVHKNIILPNGQMFTHNRSRRKNVIDNDDLHKTLKNISQTVIMGKVEGRGESKRQGGDNKKTPAKTSSGMFDGYLTAQKEKVSISG
ncbi:hypothetical protein EON65_26485 [archaeon]|nr:MAG: hypothetical protein EON65_26485 [archaeon]